MKLVIIGAGSFQVPLIQEAKKYNYETHVFAWETGAVGKEFADFFYPISIVDKEEILKVIQPLNVSGVLSIASEVAVPTVAFLSEKLGLKGNSVACSHNTLNKYNMKKCFQRHNIPCADGFEITDLSSVDFNKIDFSKDYIVKPVDRSGSLAVELVTNQESATRAIQKALSVSFSKKCLMEEFVQGSEFSVETISYNGQHRIVAITEKTTTGAPYFVEKHHYISNNLDIHLKTLIEKEIPKALDALDIRNGVSHVELKIHNNKLYFIEIGGRMGGDYIGSHLVPMSKNINLIKAAIDIATDQFKWDSINNPSHLCAGVSFLCTPNSRDCLVSEIKKITISNPIQEQNLNCTIGQKVSKTVSSCTRYGYVIYSGPSIDDRALSHHFGVELI